jgi:hypothetical protein
MHIDVLATDLGFTEGPVWLPEGRIALTSLSHGCRYVVVPRADRWSGSSPVADPTVRG